MKKNKIVYVCSPLRGDMERNIVRANYFSRFVFEKGCIPIAPHVIFTQFLDDAKPKERKRGIEMGIALLKLCDELWVFSPTISEGATREADLPSGQSVAKAGSKLCLRPGQKTEIEAARKRGLPTRYFSEDMEEE